MDRREALRQTALLATGGLASLSTRAFAARRRPNIIYIMADDLGYGDLGCYGQKRIRTPNIDRMAAEGMRFTDCYAGSTVCAPSRCVLMTGEHTGHSWIRGNGFVPLRPGDITVAEVLQRAGYATGLVGKWGCGEEGSTGIPTKKGFDYFFGYLNQHHAHNYYPAFLWRNTEKVKLHNVVDHRGKSLGGVATVRKQYSHDLFVQEALDFLDRNCHRPFFLYLALTIPHANNEAGKEGMEVPDLGEYANKDWPAPQKGHAAMISRMDRDIGRLFQRLKDLGIDRDTIVFFTSDNGPHREGGNDPAFNDSNGPLRGIKRDLYEGGIRVPMIVRWPGKMEAGAVSHFPWAFWDFLPTAADLAHAERPTRIDGRSVLPTLMGKSQQAHRFLYWEFHERGSKQAVRMGRWKAVRLGPNAPLELYDLLTDIGETRNVAAQHPDIVRTIEDYLKTARTPNPHWSLKEFKPRRR